MVYKRSDRVGDLVRKEIAYIILHGDIKDPRVGMVTITKVRMSGDLRQAKIFFSMIGGKEDVEKTKLGLQSASGYIRSALAKRLSLRFVPSIAFEFDNSLEYSAHIERVIMEIKKKGGS